MLSIPAFEVTFVKWNVDDVQVKRFVRCFPVKFNTGLRKTLEEARITIHGAYGSSSDSPIHHTISLLSKMKQSKRIPNRIFVIRHPKMTLVLLLCNEFKIYVENMFYLSLLMFKFYRFFSGTRWRL